MLISRYHTRQGRLAVTAADATHGSTDGALEVRRRVETAAARVGFTCHTAAGGRRAVRALAQWARRFELTEPEFQVLWCLRSPVAAGFDQTTLARRLAYSPAQVSATVERLRGAGWIVLAPITGDRRKNLWQLSEPGRRLLDKMVATASYLQFDGEVNVELTGRARTAREAAA